MLGDLLKVTQLAGSTSRAGSQAHHLPNALGKDSVFWLLRLSAGACGGVPSSTSPVFM